MIISRSARPNHGHAILLRGHALLLRGQALLLRGQALLLRGHALVFSWARTDHCAGTH